MGVFHGVSLLTAALAALGARPALAQDTAGDPVIAAPSADAPLAPSRAQSVPPVATPSLYSTGEPASVRAKGGDPVAESGFPDEALGYPRASPRYYTSRWAEDWSYLRNRDLRRDLFDPFKFIPLNADGSVYLTLSNQERLGLLHVSNPTLKAGPDENVFLTRILVGADLHLGPHLRIYTELENAEAEGTQFNKINGIQRNDLLAEQAFVELSGKLGGARVGVMAGIQEFTDAPLLVAAIRDIPNVHYTYAGVRAYANFGRFRVDAVDFHSMALGAGAFDDPVNTNEAFRGFNSSLVLIYPQKTRKLFLDPFLFNYQNNLRRWGTTTGDANLLAYGARSWGALGPLTFDWTGERQTGTFTNRPIRAFGLFATQGLLVSAKPAQPTLTLRFDVASGGGSFSKGTLHSLDPLFGNAAYFSDGVLFAGSNLVDVSPGASFKPTKSLTLLAESARMWRYASDDSIYAGTRAAYTGSQSIVGRSIGQFTRVKLRWAINQHLSLSASTEYLKASSALKKAGWGDSFYGGSYLFFRF